MNTALRVSRVERLDTIEDTKVYDITVKDNHNFFIRPKNSEKAVLVSNCHAWTAQASDAFLKPLEEPPARTMWILCTTNPEKLKPTILGRCKKLPITKIDPKVLVRRLAYISAKEGVSMKEREDGANILKLIADLSNGQMRDSIEMLETVLLAIASGEPMDAKGVLQKLLLTGEADLDKASAYLVAAVLSGNLKSMLKVLRTSQNSRGVLSKTRWLLQYLLDNSVGLAKYSPYNAKLFAKLSNEHEIKVKLSSLIDLQFLLVEIESKFNTMPIDESVVMLSMIGNYMNSKKVLGEETT